MWKILTLIAIAGLVAAGPVTAGKNAGGALVVHCYDQPIFSGFQPCVDFDDPGNCMDARTQSNRPETEREVVWLLAAFHDLADPGVRVIYFGLEHNLPPGSITDWGLCGPGGSIEVPDGGWPHEPETAGNSIGFSESITGDLLFPFYWFYAYGFEDAYLGTGINPTGGYAAFVSDDDPGVLDEIHRFGTVRWYEPGENECPVAGGFGACCFDTGECRLILDLDCWDLGGHFLGAEIDCDPNPCPYDPGACCFADGHCEVLSEYDCGAFNGSWLGSEASCDPNPCEQPLQACCLEGGECSDLTDIACVDAGGTPQGLGTSCAVVFCKAPAVGACCLPNAECIVLIETDCGDVGGIWYETTTCNPNPCVVPTVTTSWGRMKELFR
ncbi:MAG: hypothetical protein GF346_05490 [Candidatus Eisenbacteria bacterium]|nr:hypothetical protein [Candidatus Latescibacterota bacterium]MBD3301881.1 hypothetical protein [Candidatus Eisenbacteria bacterium]